MMELPPHFTSTTGIDALPHTVKAYVGRFGIPFTEENAEKAIKIILEDPEVIYREGADCEEKPARPAIVVELGEANEPSRVFSYRFIEKVSSMKLNMNIPATLAELQEKNNPLIAQRVV